MKRQVSVDIANYLLTHYAYDMESHKIRNIKTGHARKPIIKQNGYCQLGFRYNNKYHSAKYHIIVWLLVHHEWPTDEIDHIDGNPTNNRIDNLRVVSSKENSEFPRSKWVDKKNHLSPGVCSDNGRYDTQLYKVHIRSYDPFGMFFFAILCGKRFKDGDPPPADPPPAPPCDGGE